MGSFSCKSPAASACSARRTRNSDRHRPTLAAMIAILLAACGSSSTQTSGFGASTPSPPPYNAIYGVDLGIHVLSGKNGEDPVPEEEVIKLLSVLRGRALWVRIYNVSGTNQDVPKLAHDMGFKVAASAILDGRTADDDYAIGKLVDDVNKGYVDYAIVGSEEIHVKLLTVPQELARIQDVKQKLSGRVPVGTVEPDKVLLAHPEVMRACDLVLANIPPISYGVPLDKSLDYIKTTYARLVAEAGGSEVGIGETEWPSAGFGSTVADEATYFSNVETWARAQALKVFYYEAFDEPWLGQYNAVGAHWGLWTSDLQLKPGMDQVFAKR